MKGIPYQQASRAPDAPPTSDPVIQEALAKHAAARPPKSPPKIMPITPTLKKVVKGRRRRRTV